MVIEKIIFEICLLKAMDKFYSRKSTILYLGLQEKR